MGASVAKDLNAVLSERAQARTHAQLLSVLEPIARIARRNGFATHEAVALFREAMYTATIADTTITEPSTPARQAIASGLTRGDVEQIHASREHRAQFIRAALDAKNVANRVASMWASDSRFAAPYSAALPLAYSPDTSKASQFRDRPTFTELVKEVEPNADPASVLASLTELGMAMWAGDDNDELTLAPNFSSILDHGSDSTFWYVTSTLSGLAHTLATNAYDLYPSPKLCERRAVSDRLVDEQALRTINELLRPRLVEFLDSALSVLERPLDDDEQAAAPESAKHYRMSVAAFVIADGADDGRVQPKAASTRRIKTIDLASPNAAMEHDD